MYSPVHATAGLLIATAIPHPAIGIPVALLSHYALDMIPHGDTHFGYWVKEPGRAHRILIVEIIDLGTAAAMTAWLVAIHPEKAWWYLVAAAIAGILPDLIWGTRFVLQKIAPPIPLVTNFLAWHDRLHSVRHARARDDISFRAGVIYQAALLAVVLIFRL